MIYVDLRGRIGNQLFIYAMAESLRQQRGGKEELVFFDSSIINNKWENSLYYYNIPNVRFIHRRRYLPLSVYLKLLICENFYKYIAIKPYSNRFLKEKKYQNVLFKLGIVLCENGFIQFPSINKKDIFISGYFQSQKYFDNCKSVIRKRLNIKLPEEQKYCNLIAKLKDCNSVCISIKVEHNIGSALYDVCNIDYYKKAIAYIMEKVEKPLFFICSDNVQYVVDNLIDTDNVEYVCQDKTMTVYESLQIMSYCKHYILSNTSFGWWAQYMCENQGKIVIAPNKWMRQDMPIDLYDDNWTLIDVSNYINETT